MKTAITHRMKMNNAVDCFVIFFLLSALGNPYSKMKINARESLIKLRFNCNLLFIVRLYHNHQHYTIIVGGLYLVALKLPK